MRFFLPVLLVCVVFGVGVWVGFNYYPTQNPPTVIYETDTTETYITVTDSTIVDSLLDQLEVVKDSVVYYNNKMKALLKDNPIDYVVSHINEVNLTRDVSFKQKTLFDYETAKFKFDYSDISVPSYQKVEDWRMYTNVSFLATTDLQAMVLANYKWFTIGYKTDNTFMAGVNFNLWALTRK